MRKFIIEFELDDDNDSTLKQIENDVFQELSCCWNHIENVRVKEITKKKEDGNVKNMSALRRDET